MFLFFSGDFRGFSKNFLEFQFPCLLARSMDFRGILWFLKQFSDWRVVKVRKQI